MAQSTPGWKMAEETSVGENDATPTPRPPPPTIGIGASAGGVKALQALFDAMPEGMGAAFVVIVHLDPNSHSELAEIISAHSTLDVEQVTATTLLKPDHVYVIPPDRQLRISDHEVSAVPFDEPRGHRAPIDLFFRSLAEQKSDGCAVILTGAGSDGAIGARAIKEAGGIVLVQDPEEAEYPSMPRSVIATDAADFILPIRELGPRLAELIRAKKETRLTADSDDDESLLRRILAHLRARTGHDFSNYKRSTVHRRVLRRMQVSRMDSLQSYFHHLRGNAGGWLLQMSPGHYGLFYTDEGKTFEEGVAVSAGDELTLTLEQFGIGGACKSRFACGYPAARREKKPIRLPSCCSRKQRAGSSGPRFRFLPRILIQTLSPLPVKGVIRMLSQRMSVRSGSSGSSQKMPNSIV